MYPTYNIHLPLKYVDPDRIRVLHDFETDPGCHVKVIGDPANGAYEWLIENADGGVMFSDVGYGIPECALRDGLAVWWGDSVDVAKLKSEAKSKTKAQLGAYKPRWVREQERAVQPD